MIAQTTGKGSVNRATLAITATLGVIFGISGFGHGLFEALQGYTPTGGLMISAISDAHLFWPQGHEPALTFIPNFLFSGIAAMLISLAAIVWSIGFLHRRRGSLVFLVLFVLLLLVGGGVAQVIFFPVFFILAARIHTPPAGRGRTRSHGARRLIGKLWVPFLAVSAALILYTLQVAIFGYVPGITDPEAVSLAMVSILGAGYLFLILAVVAGFARDTEKGDVSHA